MKSENDKPSTIGSMIKKSKEGKQSVKATPPKDDPVVTFTMNARKSHRQWWAGQAKLQGKTMTDIATAALIEEFGLPPDS